IVGYHRVVENFAESARYTIPAMLVSTATFEKQIDWLARHFLIASLDDVAVHLEEGRPFSRPVAAITFDDGYADVYHNAFPLLKGKGFPAAVFVVTNLIGTKKLQMCDRLYMCLARQMQRNPFEKMTAMLTQLPQSEILRRVEEIEASLSYDAEAVRGMAP